MGNDVRLEVKELGAQFEKPNLPINQEPETSKEYDNIVNPHKKQKVVRGFERTKKHFKKQKKDKNKPAC